MKKFQIYFFIFFNILYFWQFSVADVVSKSLKEQKIIFENLNEETQKDIEKKFFSKINDENILSVLDDIIRYLHISNLKDIIEVRATATGYVIKAINSTRIEKVIYKNVKSLSISEVKNIFGLNESDVLDKNAALDGTERIRKYYSESGFLNAKVSIEIQEIEKDKVMIVIDVNEGAPTKISEIIFNSPNRELNAELKRHFKYFQNKNLTDSVLNEFQNNLKIYLLEKNIIQGEITNFDKSYDQAEEKVTLKITLNKISQYTFDFEGYKELSRFKLTKVLDIENYSSSNPNVASELAQKIKSYYLKNGYARVDVKTIEEELKQFQKKVTFKILEGPKVQIENIVFQGSYSRKVEFYSDLFYQLAVGNIADKIYFKDELDSTLELFKQEIQNQGFLLFQIQNIRTIYNSKKDKVTLYFVFDEGPLTLVDDIHFQGNQNISSVELMNVIGLMPGKPLELFKLEKSISKLKSYYQEKGFLEFNLLNEKDNLVTYDSTNTKAKLNYQILEGPKVKVNSIAIEGNYFTKDKVVLIELEFKNGDILSPSKIDESISRLQKTGFFNSVEIKTLEQKTNIADRTVIVKVSERDPGVFNLGVGATNERRGTLRGYTGVAYRNLLGTGRGVSARLEGNYNIADIKYPEIQVILGYVEPYLFDSRLRGRVSVTRSRLVSAASDSQGIEKNQYTYSLEKDFTSHITGVFKVYNLEQSRDFVLKTNENIQELNIASIGPEIDIDYRDNPFLPTQGVFARMNLEYASPVLGSSSTVEFYKTTGSVTHYWPLYKKLVWANNLTLGYLENLNHDENGGVPYNKRGFILGGRSTIRGYELGTQEVLPNNMDLGLKSDSEIYTLKTSAAETLIKSELRFPLYGNIYGAVFYDGGSVYIKDKPFEDNYRDSVGFGLRYNFPVGAFNMEVGKKLDKKPSEDEYRYHLSFGTF